MGAVRISVGVIDAGARLAFLDGHRHGGDHTLSVDVVTVFRRRCAD